MLHKFGPSKRWWTYSGDGDPECLPAERVCGESCECAAVRVVVKGVPVVFVNANHCPGAVMLLFDVAGKRFLHSGDFRFALWMEQCPLLRACRPDVLYLDTVCLFGLQSFW